MFPREYRLSRQRDIQRLLKSGRRYPSPALMVRVLPNQVGHLRLTVVAGTVVSKSAVVRNRARRQLRALLADEVARNRATDVMLTIKSPFLSMTREDRRTLLRSILRQARLT